MKHRESELQRRCVKWFRIQYPRYRLLLFAVPNGGARSAVEAAIMKAEGVTAGVADLLLLLPSGKYSCLCIEMKNDTSTSRQSENQKMWQREVEDVGAKYEVVRTFERFVEVINGYLDERNKEEGLCPSDRES